MDVRSVRSFVSLTRGALGSLDSISLCLSLDTLPVLSSVILCQVSLAGDSSVR